MFSLERYAAARHGAAVVQRSSRGRILLTGGDRLTYLQGLLTNDVAALTSGSGCYAALLTPQGRMISDMRVFETGAGVLLDVPGEIAARVASHLSDFIFSEDAAVEDVTGTLAHIVLIGAAASTIIGLRQLRPFENLHATFEGIELTAAGNDEFGVPAFDCFVDARETTALVAALANAGVTPVEDEVAEALRIEAGTPRFGADMDETTIPLEAGIEDRAISLTKGCYVGQEVIIRVLHRGHGRVARKLVGVLYPADGAVPPRGELLHSGERQVGAVTSATWSPALGRPIALGYVHRDFSNADTVLESGDAPRQAVSVTVLPFTATATR